MKECWCTCAKCNRHIGCRTCYCNYSWDDWAYLKVSQTNMELISIYLSRVQNNNKMQNINILTLSAKWKGDKCALVDK
jgi:hypothetical protein